MEDSKQAELLQTAFTAYLRELNEAKLDPVEPYLPFNADAVKTRQWSGLGGWMVEDELREITNKLNNWHYSLKRWHAWNNVITRYSESDAWNLRKEFLEALAHYCLLVPSAMRDTFTFVATNSMHQVRLVVQADYRDYLEGDSKILDEKAKHLSRRNKEARLARIVAIWPEGAALMSALRELNKDSYRKATAEYRNLNSHAIGPRLGIGMTRTVVRSVEQATTMEQQPDGTYLPTPLPGKMSVSYAFGGTEPLDLEDARLSNYKQYLRARECFASYRALLQAGLEAMPVWQPN